MINKIKSILNILMVFIIYPLVIVLLSNLFFNPIGYLEALLYSFIIRVIKYNWINNIIK